MPAQLDEPSGKDSDDGPSVRTVKLANARRPIRCSKYAVVGSYADGHANFVQHAAILKELTTVDGSNVKVFHMGPPPVAGPSTAQSPHAKEEARPDLIGDLVLTNHECEAVTDWLAGVEKECAGATLPPLQYYIIRPHADTPRSEERRRRPRRFNCAGFVIEAYREADIELLNLDALPDVNQETLRPIYGFFFDLEGRDERTKEKFGFKGRSDLGIRDGEPWDIALPGYLFHSSERATPDDPRLGPMTAVAEQASYPVDNT